MGSMLRSEEMSLCQIFVQPEVIYSAVTEIGIIGIAQFKDLNPVTNSFQRKYTAEIRRIDEMERQLVVIHRELKKDEIKISKNQEDLLVITTRAINNLETIIENSEKEITELSQNFSQLQENHRELIEYRNVLQNAEHFLAQSTNDFLIDEIQEENCSQLDFVAGVIDFEKFISFERMLWRVSLGNIFVKHAMIDEPFKDFKDNDIYKCVFIVFFQGDTLKKKVQKVCEGYHAKTFSYPANSSERMDLIRDLQARERDIDNVINQTRDHRARVLNYSAKSFNEWSLKLKKLKSIFHTMNMFSFDVSQKCLVGECWVPTKQIHLLKNALEKSSGTSNVVAFINVIGTNETPPTFHQTNKFTRGFQNLIDAYGMASYREANPGLSTIVTFPFLFAVMYGDIGHGLLILLFSIWMIISEKKLEKVKEEIFNIFFTGRYIILMMGLFSLYTGFIYNDIFSKSMNIFGSSWRINYTEKYIMENEGGIQLNPSSDDLLTGRTYPAGLDPIWQLATDNKILFLNSYKMKLSIIFGVTHMLFGICVSVINHNFFRQRSKIFLEFLPQILFLLLIFGYLVFMMFFKWVRFDPKADQPFSPGCAPNVLVYFINMILFGSEKELEGCNPYMYPGQRILQIVFIVLALLCIPWMLIGTPLYVKLTRNKRRRNFALSDEIGETTSELSFDDEEPMSEIWIHQTIHTIEYVLGTISHTASYLRLWALSLAHAQLSEVLWTNLWPIAFINVPFIGPVMIYYVFSIWSCVTLGILVVIEGLSAFLHTLRLHWVEFMSKFYIGEGYKFEPFSFEVILNDGD